MTAAEILFAMTNSDTLAEEVTLLLNEGMLDEWDTSLCDGLASGFGGAELRIAARTAYAMAINKPEGE